VGKKPLLIAYNAWPADGGATFNQESIFWGEEKLIWKANYTRKK
jgi:hypothetical protein